MADVFKLRISVGGVPTTFDMTSTDNVLNSFNFKLTDPAVTASKPLKVDGTKKITSGNIDLTSEITGTLPIGSGGTGSSTALNNNRVMQSSGSAIVEAAAITASRALESDSNGIPVASTVTAAELGYVSGVTSAIQTQLGTKVAKAGDTMDSGANLTFTGGGEPLGLPATPSGAGAATSAAYVDAQIISGGKVKECILHISQLSDAQGIRAALALFVQTLPAVSDTFILEDGTNTETYTFKAAESVAFDVAIGAAVADTMTNLAAAIAADSSFWGAIFEANALDSINADGAIVLYELVTAAGASTSRTHGVIAGGQSAIQVLDFAGLSEYNPTLATTADLDAADGAAVQMGLRREVSALVNGEIHASLADDSLTQWDGDGAAWYTLSSGAIPEATAGSGGAVKGKATFDSDKGLDVTSGVAESKIDDNTINFNGSGQHQIKDLGVATGKIAADAVTGAKIRLANDEYLRARNNAGSGDINIVKVGTDDLPLMGLTFKVPSASTASDPDHVVSLKELEGLPGEIAGESFAANTTFVVRWGLTAESHGRVYKATKDEQASPSEYRVIGVAQIGSSLVAGQALDVIKRGKINLLSADANLIAGDEGKECFLQNAGAFSAVAPNSGVTSGDKYASFIFGRVVSRDATVTNTVIEVDASPGGLMGIDLG